MHYVYILRCADGSLYTGYAVNVEARIAKHNAGKGAKYTRSRLPVELVSFWEFPCKSEAMKAEYRIKRLSRSQKLSLIKDSNMKKESTNSGGGAQPRDAWMRDVMDELKIPKQHQIVLETFVMLNWVELAAYAYGGFKRSGRGLLIIAASGSLATPKIEYVYINWAKDQQTLREGCDNAMFDRLHGYVTTYDPEEEIVFVFEFNHQIAQELEQQMKEDVNSFVFKLKARSVTFNHNSDNPLSVPLPTPKRAYQTLASTAIAQAIKEFN